MKINIYMYRFFGIFEENKLSGLLLKTRDGEKCSVQAFVGSKGVTHSLGQSQKSFAGARRRPAETSNIDKI